MPKNGERDAARKEAAELIQRAFPPDFPGEATKARMARAVINLKWSLSRVDDIWNEEPSAVIHAHEMDRLRALPAPEAKIDPNISESG